MVVWRCFIEACFLWRLSLDISRATVGSRLSRLTLSCLSPNKQILPADSMPGSVWNNQFSCPSQACQANQKAGEDKQSCAAVLRTKWSTSGASEEDRGTGCTLNGPLCSPRKTFRITEHPIVGQVTLLHTHPQRIPTNRTFTFTPTLFLHSFTASLSWWLRLGCILQGGRKDSLCYKWMEWLQCPHPLFLQSVADSARQTLHVQPPKHSTCHSSLTGCWKWVCILIFSAPIHYHSIRAYNRDWRGSDPAVPWSRSVTKKIKSELHPGTQLDPPALPYPRLRK